jgi:hypothetical protein
VWTQACLYFDYVLIGVNCNRTRLYFDYALIGAAGARELSSEIDYTDDYATNDYSHTGVHARLILNTY